MMATRWPKSDKRHAEVATASNLEPISPESCTIQKATTRLDARRSYEGKVGTPCSIRDIHQNIAHDHSQQLKRLLPYAAVSRQPPAESDSTNV